MLVKILKLFGLDLPAKIEAARAIAERRLEQATEHVGQAAQEAAVIAAFYAVAIIAATAAAGVGLVAVYRWTAEFYGPYAGLAAVGIILVLVTLISAAAAATKRQSLANNRMKLAATVLARETSKEDGSTPLADATISTSSSDLHRPAAEMEASRIPSASDLVEPLAFVFSKYLRYPSVGNPLVDELIGKLRTNAQGTAHDAIERAAAIVRHGDRTNLVAILGTAVMVGWFLSHHFKHPQHQ